MTTPSTPDQQHDALIDVSAKAFIYYHEHKSRILGIAAGVLIVVLGAIGFGFWNSSREQTAQELLGSAEQYLTIGDFDSALFGNDAAFTMGLEQIHDQYGGTRAGNLAAYYAAIAHFELGQMEDAASFIQSYDPPSGIMGVGPLSLKGEILSAKGDHEAAAEAFVDASQQNVNDVTTPALLFQAAQAYEAGGDPAKALELVDRILDEYPLSLQVARAESLKGKLLIVTE